MMARGIVRAIWRQVANCSHEIMNIIGRLFLSLTSLATQNFYLLFICIRYEDCYFDLQVNNRLLIAFTEMFSAPLLIECEEIGP